MADEPSFYPIIDNDEIPDAPSSTLVPSYLGTLSQAVKEISDVTEAFKNEVLTTVQSMLLSAGELNQDTNEYSLPELSDPTDVEITPISVGSSPLHLGLPEFTGTIPTFTTPVISVGTPPEMQIDIPAFSVPAPPDVEVPALDATAPSIDAPTLPSRPAYTLPPVPHLASLTIPDPPTYDIPDFIGDIPVFDLTPPDATLDWAESNYNSQLSSQIEGKLRTDIAADLSGLNAIIENSIYARATARQETDNVRMVTEEGNFFSSRGFTLPAPSLASVESEVQARVESTRTNLENDIDIQAAKLIQAHKEFVRGAAVEWEGELVAYHDQAMDRAFAASKAAVEVMIDVYKGKVEGYRGQTEIYSAMADVYSSRISAELAKAEFYKAQIEGVKLTIEAQRSMILAYNAQIEGISILADVYRAEMEAAKIQTEVDTVKMQSYTALVKAFRYQIEANAARYKLYVAQIMGEEAKVKMYQALVEAYDAQVEAYAELAQVEIAKSRIRIEEMKGKAEVYAAQVKKYAGDVSYYVGSAEIGVLAQKTANTIHDAFQRIQEASIHYRGQVANSQASEKATRETAEAQIKAAETRAMAELEMIASKTKSAAARGAARRAASSIAAHSKSENWSASDSDNNTVAKRTTRSWNTRSTINHNWGIYHRYYTKE